MRTSMTPHRTGLRAVRRRTAILATVVGLLSALVTGAANAQPGPAIDPSADIAVDRPVSTAPTEIPAPDRDAVLGTGWQGSRDRSWTTSGDADGFHFFVADAAQGYAWRETATLSEPGLDADQWVGNACVTASGRRAVVVYAPRGFLNRGPLFNRGGFTAVLDLETNTVNKLPIRSSLAYFNPSCGAGEEAVLTQGGDEDLGRTRLVRVRADAPAASAVGIKIEVPGQLTSAVPTPQGIVAADDGALVRVADDGTRRVLALTRGVPFGLAVDGAGGVVFAEQAPASPSGVARAAIRRAPVAPLAVAKKGKPAPKVAPVPAPTLATAALTNVDVTSGRGGRVFVTGTDTTPVSALPAGVSVVDLPAGTEVSTEGALAVTGVRATQAPLTTPESAAAAVPVEITATVLRTGRPVTLLATPDMTAQDVAQQQPGQSLRRGPDPEVAPGTDGLAPGRATSPGAGLQATAGAPNDPADPTDRYCSVPRNDPRNQAMQPKPRQVEWAVDQAVTGSLTVSRPANWKNLGMPAYTPQGLFPPMALAGGGRVPAQIMLGIAAQESNLWQAARFAVPGVTANPLVGNYYGVNVYDGNPANDWDIDWAKADCGYGVTQLTDGMRLAGKTKPGETALPYQTQRAVALDFAANVAAGLQVLQRKWNEVKNAGLIVNNGDPAKLENWFFAVWAYNSGFYPQSTAGSNGGAWGVGWLNNPANPNYPANRTSFLDVSPTDAAHPQDWPYPEKVMGFAAQPPSLLEAPGTFVAGFRAAYWNGDSTSSVTNRTNVKPPVNQFCNASNSCVPGTANVPNAPDVVGEPAGPCTHRDGSGRFDLKCWYHQSSTWKTDCNFSCGNELLRFDPGYAYQDDAVSYAPNCALTGLPAGAKIIDDVPDGTPSVRPNCGRPWTNAGTFSLNYVADANGTYPGKIDTHQIGGGFGGHFWFAHTRTATDTNGRLKVNASWKLGSSYNGPMRVLVALPDHGANTRLSAYTVITSQGQRTRVLPQPGTGNRWLSLGAFLFNGVPEVQLSSVTANGNGSEDIAFDAVAFVPINGTPREESVEAAAVFDENQNIDTADPESWLAGPLANRQALYNWAISKADAILALPRCSLPAGDCLLPAVERAVRDWRTEVVAAGVDPVNHPAGKSIGSWIGFANSYLDRPTSTTRPASFDDDNRYKIRTKATVSFFTDGGTVVPGSEWITYEHRTGDTHLPRFVLDLFRAIGTEYASLGVTAPDLRYTSRNLNQHDGAFTSPNPMANGILPGRAYAQAGKAPVLTDTSGAPGSTCVKSLTIAGGSIGYRPMIAQSGPPAAMSTFSTKLANEPLVPNAVISVVNDLRSMFFNDGTFTNGLVPSLFREAPPIWQELSFLACADGTVRPVAGAPILRGSWMPDQYLYHNGRQVGLNGVDATGISPVFRGNFISFSQLPVPANRDTPFTNCTAGSGRSGNPWDIGPAILPYDADPASAHFCLDPALPPDLTFSSP